MKLLIKFLNLFKKKNKGIEKELKELFYYKNIQNSNRIDPERAKELWDIIEKYYGLK